MNPFLAFVDGTSLTIVVTGLTVLFGFLIKLNTVKRDLGDDIITRLKAEQSDASGGRVPQPFKVSQEAEHVSKSSFNKHLELDRKEHEADRLVHKEIWAAIEKFRSENSRKIEDLIRQVATIAGVMTRIGEDVRDAAKTANQAANTAVTALNEAQHKRA